MQHLKDKTNKTYKILVELIRLAGDKTEGWNENWTKNWNDEVGLAGVSGLGIRPGR